MDSEQLNLKDLGAPEGLGIMVFETTHSSIDPHTHAFYELVFIKSGFCLHETGKQTSLLLEGDFFLMKPGQWHRYIGPHAVELVNCMFAEEELRNLFDGDLALLPGMENTGNDCFFKLHLDITTQRRVSRMLKGIIYELAEQSDGWKIKIRSQLACLLVDYSRTYMNYTSLRSENSVYPNYVVGALDIISRSYQDSTLTVAGIAAKVNVTPDYLSRQFRTLTGVGAQEYIRRFRFSKATELLLGGVSVGDTCVAVGFTNLAHFSREFKKELGVTPTQYTKLNS